MHPVSVKIANLLGNALVIVSLFFIATIFWDQRYEIGSLNFSTGLAALLIGASIVYGFAGLLLSGAWCLLLNRLGENRISVYGCHAVYGRTQIGKYIPGNIFHFAGRHVMARRAGIPHLILLGSTVYEMLLLLATSSTLAFLGLLLTQVRVQGTSLFFVGIVLTLILGIVVVVFTSAPYLARKRGIEIPLQGIKAHLHALWPCFCLYLLFFLITGSILGALVVVLGNVPATLQLLGNVIIIYACSWIVGYVTPGAPGGVGVREAIIIFSLSTMIGEAPSTLAALLFRGITVSGDILFYFLVLKFPINERETLSD